MSQTDMTWSSEASDVVVLETLTREAPRTRVNLVGPRGDHNNAAVAAMALREKVMGRATAQFRNKAEAQQAIQDMGERADKAEARAEEHSAPQFAGFIAHGYMADARNYRAEAARIRALLPTLPD
jgi:hypothetical protein